MEKSDEEETLYEFIVRTVDDAFKDNIPMDAIRDLPTFYMYLFGAIFEFISLALFLYFILTGFDQGTHSKFISITPDSGVCTEITKAVSGTFTADTNGTWIGHNSFNYASGIYKVNLEDASISLSDYQKIMLLVKDEIEFLANISVTQDLSSNLLIWMSWQFICDYHKVSECIVFEGQSFTFTATAQYVFNLPYIDVTLSDSKSDCLAPPISSYDTSNALLSGLYQFSQFNADPTCNQVVNPVNLGYNSVLSGDNFLFKIDVRALVESMSTNIGILSISELEIVLGIPEDIYYHNGYQYIGNYYYDPLYVGMSPFYCIVNTERTFSNFHPPINAVDSLCFISLGNVSGIPIFSHFGAGNFNTPEENAPKSCQCHQFGHEPECDAFNLLSGIMFFENLSLATTVLTWLNITLRVGNAYKLNIASYNASWAAAASTYAPNVNAIISNSEWRNSSYEFCNTLLYGTCKLLIFNSYGTSPLDKALTPYNFLLDQGSCNRQFMISNNEFSNLIMNPPTPIVESYYDCVLDDYNAIMNAAGIASGNVSILIPVLVFAALPVMYLWLTLTGNVQPKPEYEKEELDSALTLLALQILRVRDNRIRGIKKEGQLVTLTKELISAARKADGTCVDSDDSDEESDEEENKKVKSSPVRLLSRTASRFMDETNNPMQSDINEQKKLRRKSSTSDIEKNEDNTNKEISPMKRANSKRKSTKRPSVDDIRFLLPTIKENTNNNNNTNNKNNITINIKRNQGVDSDDEIEEENNGNNNNLKTSTPFSNQNNINESNLNGIELKDV